MKCAVIREQAPFCEKWVLSIRFPVYEDQTESNQMLCLANIILWRRDMDNYKITVVQTRGLWDVDISQSIEDTMEILTTKKKDENSHRNSATIQDGEITTYRTYFKTYHITTTSNRRKYRTQNIPWPTKNYQV